MSYHGTILLVDDDPVILRMIGDRLLLEGYSVVTASSGEQAFDRLGTTKPDLIILDISMPGLGGLGFLRRLNSLFPHPTSPVMVFTGRQELSTFFTDGVVSAFFPKTTNPDVFLKKVHELVAQHLKATHLHNSSVKVMLLIENDHEIRSHLRNFFAKSGVEVHHLQEGEAVVDIAIQLKPDIIFIKYLLPHHNGLSLVEKLGTHPPTKDIPVILYDDTGFHSNLPKPPFVRHMVHSIADHALLKALFDVIGTPPANRSAN